VSGLILAIGYVVFVLSHLVQPDSGPPTQIREWIGILLLSTACLAGLFAWRRELLGGALSLVALILFVAVIRINQPWVIAVIATPGVLFLLTWLGHRHLPRTRAS
jgi:hypothetical protein